MFSSGLLWLAVLLAAFSAEPAAAVKFDFGSMRFCSTLLTNFLDTPLVPVDFTLWSMLSNFLDVSSRTQMRKWLYHQMVTERVMEQVDMIYFGSVEKEFIGFYGPKQSYNRSTIYTTYRPPGAGSADQVSAIDGWAPYTLATVDAACDNDGNRNGKHPTLAKPLSCSGQKMQFLSSNCTTKLGASAVGYVKSGATCRDSNLRVYYTVARNLQHADLGTGMPNRFYAWKQYDPTARPWYKKVELARQNGESERVWSDVYAFATSGELGITVASSLEKDGKMLGVVASDYQLATAGKFLVKYFAGAAGAAGGSLLSRVFIVENSTGLLVASNIASQRLVGGGKRLKATEGSDNLTRSIAKFLGGRSGGYAAAAVHDGVLVHAASTEESKVDYFVQVQLFTSQDKLDGKPEGISWLIVIAQPASCSHGSQPNATLATCVCFPPYIARGDQCGTCQPGQFFSHNSVKCEQCPVKSTSTGGVAAINQSACFCPDGNVDESVTGNNSKCEQCGQGRLASLVYHTRLSPSAWPSDGLKPTMKDETFSVTSEFPNGRPTYLCGSCNNSEACGNGATCNQVGLWTYTCTCQKCFKGATCEVFPTTVDKVLENCGGAGSISMLRDPWGALNSMSGAEFWFHSFGAGLFGLVGLWALLTHSGVVQHAMDAYERMKLQGQTHVESVTGAKIGINQPELIQQHRNQLVKGLPEEEFLKEGEGACPASLDIDVQFPAKTAQGQLQVASEMRDNHHRLLNLESYMSRIMFRRVDWALLNSAQIKASLPQYLSATFTVVRVVLNFSSFGRNFLQFQRNPKEAYNLVKYMVASVEFAVVVLAAFRMVYLWVTMVITARKLPNNGFPMVPDVVEDNPSDTKTQGGAKEWSSHQKMCATLFGQKFAGFVNSLQFGASFSLLRILSTEVWGRMFAQIAEQIAEMKKKGISLKGVLEVLKIFGQLVGGAVLFMLALLALMVKVQTVANGRMCDRTKTMLDANYDMTWSGGELISFLGLVNNVVSINTPGIIKKDAIFTFVFAGGDGRMEAEERKNMNVFLQLLYATYFVIRRKLHTTHVLDPHHSSVFYKAFSIDTVENAGNLYQELLARKKSAGEDWKNVLTRKESMQLEQFVAADVDGDGALSSQEVIGASMQRDEKAKVFRAGSKLLKRSNTVKSLQAANDKKLTNAAESTRRLQLAKENVEYASLLHKEHEAEHGGDALTDKELKQLDKLKAEDTDGGGDINQKEFVQRRTSGYNLTYQALLGKERSSTLTPEDAKELAKFKKMDLDGDGDIDGDDMALAEREHMLPTLFPHKSVPWYSWLNISDIILVVWAMFDTLAVMIALKADQVTKLVLHEEDPIGGVELLTLDEDLGSEESKHLKERLQQMAKMNTGDDAGELRPVHYDIAIDNIDAAVDYYEHCRLKKEWEPKRYSKQERADLLSTFDEADKEDHNDLDEHITALKKKKAGRVADVQAKFELLRNISQRQTLAREAFDVNKQHRGEGLVLDLSTVQIDAEPLLEADDPLRHGLVEQNGQGYRETDVLCVYLPSSVAAAAEAAEAAKGAAEQVSQLQDQLEKARAEQTKDGDAIAELEKRQLTAKAQLDAANEAEKVATSLDIKIKAKVQAAAAKKLASLPEDEKQKLVAPEDEELSLLEGGAGLVRLSISAIVATKASQHFVGFSVTDGYKTGDIPRLESVSCRTDFDIVKATMEKLSYNKWVQGTSTKMMQQVLRQHPGAKGEDGKVTNTKVAGMFAGSGIVVKGLAMAENKAKARSRENSPERGAGSISKIDELELGEDIEKQGLLDLSMSTPRGSVEKESEAQEAELPGTPTR